MDPDFDFYFNCDAGDYNCDDDNYGDFFDFDGGYPHTSEPYDDDWDAAFAGEAELEVDFERSAADEGGLYFDGGGGNEEDQSVDLEVEVAGEADYEGGLYFDGGDEEDQSVDLEVEVEEGDPDGDYDCELEVPIAFEDDEVSNGDFGDQDFEPELQSIAHRFRFSQSEDGSIGGRLTQQREANQARALDDGMQRLVSAVERTMAEVNRARGLEIPAIIPASSSSQDVERRETNRATTASLLQNGGDDNGVSGGERDGKEVSDLQEEKSSSSDQKLSNGIDDELLDGVLCPICMDPWSGDGDHYICCLPCGHLYGMSCIKTWFQHSSSGKCPQCNQECSLKDIRRVYGSRVGFVEKELMEKIKSLEAKCATLELKDADWRKKEAEGRQREAL